MRAAVIMFLGATACAGSAAVDTPNAPAPTEVHEPKQPEAEQQPSSLRERLTMFFAMDEVGEGPRRDAVNDVQLIPWQRVSHGTYSANARGTMSVDAIVGQGQHVSGSVGYHFSTYSVPPMDHTGESFTWAGWVTLDAADGAEPYSDDQALVAKWNSFPDTGGSATDHREYRVWHDQALSRWRFAVSLDGLEGEGHAGSVTHPTPVERDKYYFVEAWHDAQRDSINLRVSTQRERGEVATERWDRGVFVGGADLNVGAQNTCTDDHLQGVIDALGYWNRVLSDDESASLWNDGAGLEL